MSILDIELLHQATVTASSNYGAGFWAQAAVDRSLCRTGNGWLAQASATPPLYLTFDLLSAKFIDTFILGTSPNLLTESLKSGEIQSSDDGAAWSTWATLTDFFGAVTPTTAKAKAATGARESHRYWRVKLDTKYSAATAYHGISQVMAFDSTLLGGVIDNTNITAEGVGWDTLDMAKLFDENVVHEGFYNSTHSNAVWDLDLGSAKFVGGMAAVGYSGDYSPREIAVWTSADGLAFSLGEVFTVPSYGGLLLRFWKHHFRRIYKTRYLRLVFVRDHNGNTVKRAGTNLWTRVFINASLTPPAPAAPTGLIVTGDKDDPASLQLRWSQARADDNESRDLDWEIQRSKDGGAYATIGTVSSRLEARGDQRQGTEPRSTAIHDAGDGSAQAYSLEASDAADLSAGAALTLGGWVGFIGNGGGTVFGGMGELCSKWNSANNQNEFLFSFTAGSLRIYLAASLTDTATYAELTVANCPLFFQRLGWQIQHLAFVFDGSLSGNANRMKVFVDGVQQTLAFGGTIPASLQNGTSKFRLGNNKDGTTSNRNSLRLRSWGFWTAALTGTDMVTLYNGGVPLDRAGLAAGLSGASLIHYWNLDEKGSSNRQDSVGTAHLVPTDVRHVTHQYAPELPLPDTSEGAFFVDPGLASGSYTYKVRAVHHFHQEASAYTSPSTAEVVPVAAGGGLSRGRLVNAGGG